MADVKIKIVAKADSAEAWWMTVDQQDLQFDGNGEATAMIAAGSEHLLYYWLFGNPGTKLEFTISQAGDTLLEGTDAVPQGYFKLGNARFFKTN